MPSPITRAATLAIAAILTATPAHAQDDPPPLGIGDLAPPLALEHLQQAPGDARATWDALRGKIVILEFWATWCGPCIAAIPHINELHAEFKDRDVVFIAITYESPDLPAVAKLFEKRKYDTWIGYDTDRALHDALGIRAIPRSIVVDGYGRVADVLHPASLTSERIEQYLTGYRAAPEPAAADDADFVPRGATAGIDPYSRIQDPPLAQFILRTSSGKSFMVARGGPHLTALGMTAPIMLAYLHDVPSRYVDASALADDARAQSYDLILRDPGVEGMDARVRRVVAGALGLTTRTEPRTVDGYRLVRLDAADTVPEASGFDKQLGWSTGADGFSSESIAMESFASVLASQLSVPVTDATGLEGYYTIKLELPSSRDPEDIDTLLRDALSLTLEPDKHDVEFLVIEPVRPEE